MKKKNLVVILSICVCGVIAFSVLAVYLAKSQNNTAGSDSDPATNGAYIDENGTLIVPEGSDYLPESCVGSWEVKADSHVLQSPRNTEMSEEDAIASEVESGLLLAYDSYRTNRISSVASPYYKVTQNCTTEALDAVGMQSDGIMDEFGDNASITKIDVYEQDGTTLADTLFVINDQYLVYYGTGNFVFAATKVEAVG